MRKLNLVGIAVILFVALISTQVIYGQMHKPGMMQGDHHEKMMKNLNLTEAQQEAVQKLHFKHQNEMIDLEAGFEKEKLAMQELKNRGNYSRDEFLSQTKSISNAKEKIALARANHKMDVYELLTDEQRKTFDEMGEHIGDRMKMKKMKHKKMMEKE